MRRRALIIAVSGFLALSALGVGAAHLLALHHYDAELSRARREMGSGLFGRARNRLERLAERWPDRGEIALELGRCEAARGNPREALAAWSRIRPDSRWAATAALEIVGVAMPLGCLTQVEGVLRAAMDRPGPEIPALRHVLLVLLGQQGRLTEARRLIESHWRQTRLVPADDLPGRLVLVREHVALDFEPFPLEWNLSQLERGPSLGQEEDRRALALARAYLATHAGRSNRADEEIRRCLERWPEDPSVWKARLDWAVVTGRADLAWEAAGHLPARLLEPIEIGDLRAWFARRRHDLRAERCALEKVIARDPGRSVGLARLVELLHQSGEDRAAADLQRRKVDLDAARDRYFQLYKEDRYAQHLPELAALAERLGRRFESRAFGELAWLQDPAGPAPAPAPWSDSADEEPAPQGQLSEALGVGAWSPSSPRIGPSSTTDAGRGPVPHFEDDAEAAGLAGFVQENGHSPIHQLPEMASGGLGLLDYDGDGWLDIYCVQGGPFPPADAPFASGDRLYRNRRDGTFLDVTKESGLAAMIGGYGHGVAVGDYDNDGHPDLFITRWRSYALYRNRGDGTFEDATERAALGGDRDWPTSAAWADLDNDADLDLYVCHYGAWDTRDPLICKDPAGTVVLTCDPRRIRSLPDHVFRNDGGRFVDVTSEAGIVDPDGRGFGVVAADLDGDGRMDLFVANDSTSDYLFRNLGGFRFEEVGHEAGVAANAGGGYQAGMGVACGDLDGDGRLDLAVTNFFGESTTLFHNLGQRLFADHTNIAGLAIPSRYRLGFGAAFLDANNDGWLDLMTANGHISDQRPLFPYAMEPQFLLGGPGGRLADVTEAAGPPFLRTYVGRGLAVGDLDNDGQPDAVMVAQNGPLVFFHNRGCTPRGHFLVLQLEGTRSNRDAVGTRVVVQAGGRARVGARIGGGSFQSAGDPRLHFGLGSCDRTDSVEVAWPSGQIEGFSGLEADRAYLLREGEGTARPSNEPRPAGRMSGGR